MKHTYPVEVLWCPNLRGNGWSFHPTVRKKLLADTHGKSVLHLFGGASTFGIRLDVDPVTRPDVIGDAWLPPFRPLSFDVVIIDPPYFHLSAQTKTALLRAAGTIARERVIWWHTVWISASGGVSLERAWLVRTGRQLSCSLSPVFCRSREEGACEALQARPGDEVQPLVGTAEQSGAEGGG